MKMKLLDRIDAPNRKPLEMLDLMIQLTLLLQPPKPFRRRTLQQRREVDSLLLDTGKEIKAGRNSYLLT
jgi:hypothetical protein